MKVDKLKELGFNFVKEYVHGDNDEFITMEFHKGILIVDLDFNKNSGKLLRSEVDVDADSYVIVTLKELTQLDKILNK